VTTGNQIIESFDVSPDGRWLAFDSDRTGNQDQFSMPLAGGEQEQLTSDPGDDFQPTYSPDGSELAFHGFRNGTRDLLIMSADGTNPRTVVGTAAQDRDPSWSRDGKMLVFDSDVSGEFQLYTVARNGDGWGVPKQLTSSGAIFPFWSPDGQLIAFDWPNGLQIIPPTGGPPRLLPMTGPLAGRSHDYFAFAWAPDSRHLLTTTSADTVPYQTLWSVPIDGSLPRALVQFEDPYTTFGRGTFKAAGGTLYFAQLTSESDIWIAEINRP
jgi:Tol biopolymer transport system component